MKVEANRKSLFSWNCSLDMDGRAAGEMEFAWLGRHGSIVVDGDTFDVRHQGAFSGAWHLEQRGKQLASANKTTFRAKFEINCHDGKFILDRVSMFGRGFALKRGTRLVGELARAGLFSRGMVGHLPDAWAASDRAFVMWLSMMMWRRRASSNNSSS